MLPAHSFSPLLPYRLPPGLMLTSWGEGEEGRKRRLEDQLEIWWDRGGIPQTSNRYFRRSSTVDVQTHMKLLTSAFSLQMHTWEVYEREMEMGVGGCCLDGRRKEKIEQEQGERQQKKRGNIYSRYVSRIKQTRASTTFLSPQSPADSQLNYGETKKSDNKWIVCWYRRDEQIPTFPLVARKKLQMGVVARGWLAWQQAVPVGLAGVGVLITAAWTRLLEKRK